MRRIIALLVAASLCAGCSRTAIATGAAMSSIGIIVMAAAKSDESCAGESTHGCLTGNELERAALGGSFLALGMAVLFGGLIALAVEEAPAAAERRRQREASLPPPPPPPPTREQLGQWRDVPPVDESAEP